MTLMEPPEAVVAFGGGGRRDRPPRNESSHADHCSKYTRQAPPHIRCLQHQAPKIGSPKSTHEVRAWEMHFCASHRRSRRNPPPGRATGSRFSARRVNTLADYNVFSLIVRIGVTTCGPRKSVSSAAYTVAARPYIGRVSASSSSATCAASASVHPMPPSERQMIGRGAGRVAARARGILIDLPWALRSYMLGASSPSTFRETCDCLEEMMIELTDRTPDRLASGLTGTDLYILANAFDDHSRASARDEHEAPHRGLDRVARICGQSWLTTESAAPGAACRPRSTSSSMATGVRWSP